RMPAAAARKSVVPDPDLYAHSDDSDDSLAERDAANHNHNNNNNKPPSKRSRTSTTSASTGARGLVRKGSKGPQPTRGSVTTDAGRRRSTRLSNEHQPQDQTTPATTAARPAPKGKKRAKPEPDAADEPETAAAPVDDQRQPAAASRGAAAAATTSQRPTTSKRPRLAGAESTSQPGTNETATAAHHPPPAAAAPPPARRGFIPRAAADLATRVHKPPPAFSAALVDPTAAGDDAAAEPFLFTTNPPTPYAKGAAAQRNAPTQKQTTARGKAPRTVPPTRHDSADDADASDAAAGAAGPSSSRQRHTPPESPRRRGAQKPVAPIHVHETPVQVRNIAFRQGLPPGTPATIVRTARRSSARGSGKRGSSIGGGFEAVPHPQVADDKLYRSTDASDPIAKRLRSIVSWAAQRTRDRIFRGVRDDEMSVAQSAAKGVIDAFIEDVCSLRVDTSVPYQEPSQSQDPARLPPHPHNESNAAKMQELEQSYAAIAREQELRQSLEPTYQSFFDSRTQAHAEASTSSYYANLLPAAARSNPSAYAATLDLSVAAPTSLEEALALGRRVMQGELVQTPAAKKGKGKTADDDAGGETSQEAMQSRVAEAQIETAAFRHQTHRLVAFTRVAAAYVAHRSSENHAALTRHNELGLAVRSTAPAPATDDGAAGLAAAVPSGTIDSAGQTDAQMRATMDPRDLLRAIAVSDTKRRPS
ncbi:hypothetical protein RHOSPDRAFT_17350, partial [Rhodotorula sp. JG-1b]